jgi:hypothetical protein
MKVLKACKYCGKEISKQVGHINRANKMGYGLYCNQTCSGLDRRTSIDDKKQVKAHYDKKLRQSEVYKWYRAFLFQAQNSENPQKFINQRKRLYKKHLAYLQTDDYKKYKKQYDERFRATKKYGQFGEAALILFSIQKIVDNRRAKQDAGLINKTKKRKNLCNSLKQNLTQSI